MWQSVLAALGIIILAGIMAMVLGNTAFRRNFKAKSREMLSSARPNPGIVTDSDLAGLPEPVRRYLLYTDIVGKERVATVRLRQKGVIRMSAEGSWKNIEAVEYYSVSPPAFVWLGQVPGASASIVLGRDSYISGRGRMLIRLLGLKTIVNATGEKMDYSSLVRYLSEMIWFPSAFLSPYIRWEAVDSRSAKVTITDAGQSASGLLRIDEKGALVTFIGDRYPDPTGEKGSTTWETPVMGYGKFNGLNLPTKGEAVWKEERGDFSYIKVEITALEYNVTGIYE